jgi:hypothetical protein
MTDNFASEDGTPTGPDPRGDHPWWCDPNRCSVEYGGGGLQGIHQSATIETDGDGYIGTAVEVSLWSYKGGRPYIQLEFPGSLREGIELTISEACWLATVLAELAEAALSSEALVETDTGRSPRRVVVTRACLGGRRRY